VSDDFRPADPTLQPSTPGAGDAPGAVPAATQPVTPPPAYGYEPPAPGAYGAPSAPPSAPASYYGAPPRPLPEAPAPLPEAARAKSGAGRFTGIAVAVALVGVLLSAVAGGAAGLLASQIGTPKSTPGVTISAPVALDATDEPIAAAAAIALPSVVNIDVTGSVASGSDLPNGHPSVPSGGTGSGVAFKEAPNGGTYILTNDHVVADSATIIVTPASGERIPAVLVGTDPETDIAVIRVSVRLPIIKVGDSEKLITGQTVIAIGSPYGLQHSVSSGVVSALHRSITTGSSPDTTRSAYPLVDVIQTDAAINPGNSGGALVERQGALVGLNSAIYTESGSNAGIGFAIPSNTAVRIATELIAGGSATHPFLGVEGRTVTAEDATAAGLAKAEGAIIENVFAETGAAKAGLKKGDVVTAINGQPVRTMDDLILSVRRSRVGDKVTLTVWRARASISIVMTVGDKPASLN